MDPLVVKVLSHPLRVTILEHLSEPASPKALAKELGEKLTTVSYHIRVLRDAQLIVLVDEIPKRGSVEHVYEAAPLPGFRTRQKIPRSVRAHASAPMVSMIIDRAVKALTAGTLDARDDSRLSCVSTFLDEQGWCRIMAILGRAEKEIDAVQRKGAERLKKTRERGVPGTIVIAGFESPKRKRKDD